MARKIIKYSCDFETTTKADDCRVWHWGRCEIPVNIEDNTPEKIKKTFEWGKDIDSFMEWAFSSDKHIYFHNLKFDGSFICSYLLKNGFRIAPRGLKTFDTVISKMGQWYKITLVGEYIEKEKKYRKVSFFDSLKKLPFPIKTIATAFNLETLKGDIDYHKERPIGYEPDENEIDYLFNDIAIAAQALCIQFNEGLTKMTNGSDALNGYKKILGKGHFENTFPILNMIIDEDIRRAYRGGFTWLHDKHANKRVGFGKVYDVNSLYPSVMLADILPFGVPIPFKGQYEYDKDYPLSIQHVTCSFEVKKNKIPTIQIKGNPLFKPSEYLKTSDYQEVDLWLTNVDLELIKEHYHLYNLHYHDGYKFQGKRGMFDDYINYWNKIKTTSKGAIKQLAKLMLNSLYGKFASQPDVTGKSPYLKDDGSLGFREDNIVWDDELEKFIAVDYLKEFRDPVYTAMGVFVTSYARLKTITTAQKVYSRIIYCDTDSIHLIGYDVPDIIKNDIDDNEIGKWAHESDFVDGLFIRQKTYMELEQQKEYRYKGVIKHTNILKDNDLRKRLKFNYYNGKLDVKCAGMPSNIKQHVNFSNFKVGSSWNGKLLAKQVNGGVVLEDSKFTIK